MVAACTALWGGGSLNCRRVFNHVCKVEYASAHVDVDPQPAIKTIWCLVKPPGAYTTCEVHRCQLTSAGCDFSSLVLFSAE